MSKELRKEKRREDQGGFPLAELLIVGAVSGRISPDFGCRIWQSLKSTKLGWQVHDTRRVSRHGHDLFPHYPSCMSPFFPCPRHISSLLSTPQHTIPLISPHRIPVSARHVPPSTADRADFPSEKGCLCNEAVLFPGHIRHTTQNDGFLPKNALQQKNFWFPHRIFPVFRTGFGNCPAGENRLSVKY